MNKIKKVIAVFLAIIMLSSFALPVTVFAADETTTYNDHFNFSEFVSEVTNEDGSTNWKKLPKAAFKAFFLIRIIEVVIQFFRNLFGIQAEVTTA